MANKKLCFLMALIVCTGCSDKEPLVQNNSIHAEALSYPHFVDHPSFDKRMKTIIAPHLLPLTHPIKEKLDAIFSQSRVTENENTLVAAGFDVIASMPRSFVTVAKHPEIPGYVFKLYLDSETRSRDGRPNWECLAGRCVGAEKIRNIIREKNISYFAVPDKWLYVLPLYPLSKESNPQPIIVVETDMEIESQEMSRLAWKTYVTSQHLDELYAILKKKNASTALDKNIPYTKNGKFAFIDTEYPKKHHKLKRVKGYLSEEMQSYWNRLL